MSIELSFFRFNEAIMRGKRSIKLTLTLLGGWIAVCLLTIQVSRGVSLVQIGAFNSVKNLDLDWEQFALFSIAFFVFIFFAFIFGYKAANADSEGAQRMVNHFLLDGKNNNNALEKVLIRVTYRSERWSNLSSVLNLFATFLLLMTVISIFLSITQILTSLKFTHTFLVLVIAGVLVFLTYFLEKYFALRKRE